MNENDYEAPRKWIKYRARELPKKPEEPEKPEIIQPGVSKPPIPLEMLDALMEKAALPRKRASYGRQDEMWENVCELKGWLAKPATDFQMAPIYWRKIKAILDDAVETHDPAAFEQFADAWKTFTMSAVDKSPVSGLAKAIADLIPATAAIHPGQPTALWILDIINGFQRKHGRAPTQKEIAVKSSQSDEAGGITEGDVSSQIDSLGLRDLMSRERQ
jgi:hypothetical protein